MDTETDYSPQFLSAVAHVIESEGGYVDDPLDKGGQTKYGISKRQYPHLAIEKITKDHAAAIYYRDYWQAYQCHKLPPAYGVFLFDSVVNHNPKTAVKFLQAGLKVTVDGYLGPETFGAANQVSSSVVTARRFMARCFSYRADFYHDLAVAKPSQERFVLGWFRRLFLLMQFIDNEVMQ